MPETDLCLSLWTEGQVHTLSAVYSFFSPACKATTQCTSLEQTQCIKCILVSSSHKIYFTFSLPLSTAQGNNSLFSSHSNWWQITAYFPYSFHPSQCLLGTSLQYTTSISTAANFGLYMAFQVIMQLCHYAQWFTYKQFWRSKKFNLMVVHSFQHKDFAA